MTYHSYADLGGQPVALAVQPEPEGDPFHAPWEARVHALTIAMGATGLWNIDMSRAVRETLPDYGRLKYYEIWYRGLVSLLQQHGLVSTTELASGRSLDAPRVLGGVLAAARVWPMLRGGSPTLRASGRPARFQVGDRVRTTPASPTGHTRLPAYARGREGCVESVRGAHVFADANATGHGEQPEWLYTVVFTAEELWGTANAQPGQTVSIDAWEPYLESA